MSHLSLTAADVPSHHYLQDPSRNFLPHVIILLVLAAIQFWAVANTGENAVNKAKRWKDRTSDCLAYWHLSGPDTGRSNGTKETVMTPQNGFNNIGGLFCLGWVGTNLVWSGEAPPPVKPAAPAVQVVPVPTGEYRVARKAASEMGRFQ